MSAQQSTSTHRPVTSKPRGICKYYTDPRGCYAGEKCKFLHAPQHDQPSEGPPLLTPYDRSKRCKFYAQGFCKRGNTCWFIHLDDADMQRKANKSADDDDEDLCSICFDKPTTYGLLAGCSHIFCIDCIKRWRDPQGKSCDVVISSNIKRCPMCRAHTSSITPSSRFYPHPSEDRLRVISMYKESMERVDCRYFQKSLQKNQDNPLCPFGRDCFYRHRRPDGTIVVLEETVDDAMRKYYASFPRFNIHNNPFNSRFFMSDLAAGPLHLFMQPPNERPQDLDNIIRQLRGLRDEMADVAGVWPPLATELPSARGGQVDPTTMLRRIEEANTNVDRLTAALGDGGGRGRPVDTDAVGAAIAALGTNPAEGDPVPAGQTESTNLTEQMRAVRSTAAAFGEGIGAWMNSIAEDANEAEVDRYEAQAIQRLGDLAGQMLASINTLRINEGFGPVNIRGANNAATAARRRNTNPPTPLIPSTPSSNRAPRPVSMYDSSASDGSMPDLRSVSSSSESDDDDDSEDGGFDNDGNFMAEDYDGQVQDARVLTALFNEWGGFAMDRDGAQAEAGAGDSPTMPSLEPVDGQTGREEGRPTVSARFSTVVDRSLSNSSAGSGIVVLGGDVPQAVPVMMIPEDCPLPLSSSSSSSPSITATTSSSSSPPPPSSSLPAEAAPPPSAGVMAAPAADLRIQREMRRKSNEFTTDGRGRVISIGGGATAIAQEVLAWADPDPETPDAHSTIHCGVGGEDDLDDTAMDADNEGDADDDDRVTQPPAKQRKSSEFTTDGRGRVISVGSAPAAEEEGAASSGGLFGWFNAFF